MARNEVTLSAPRYTGPLPPAQHGRAARRLSAKAAMEEIRDGARVHIATGCAPPGHLLRALADQRDRFTRLDVVLPYTLEPLAIFEGLGDPFFLSALHPAGALRRLVDHPAMEVLPTSVTQWDQACAPGGARPVDATLFQVAPPGPEGRYSLGVNGGETAQVARRAPFVVAQINPAMPYTFGATELDPDEIDVLVDGEEALIEHPVASPGPLEQRIAEHAAGEIPDGAIIQFGIGTLPESILHRLRHHKDLGVHGGMVGEPIVDLVEAGVMTGRSNRLNPGLLVCAGGLGTRRLFDWMHRNEHLLIAPAAYSHHPAVLGRHECFVSINSAIEVALDGATNSEWIAGKMVSGPGGQPDFAMGAHFSEHGRSLIALPATTAKGKISRIVPELAAGAPSTLPRYLADRVITEHGVARLKSVPFAERAERLRAVADPAFRDSLVVRS